MYGWLTVLSVTLITGRLPRGLILCLTGDCCFRWVSISGNEVSEVREVQRGCPGSARCTGIMERGPCSEASVDQAHSGFLERCWV